VALEYAVMDRLGEIKVPKSVMAGRDNRIFRPEHQGQLAAAIPGARLEIIERAGRKPAGRADRRGHEAVTDFLRAVADVRGGGPGGAGATGGGERARET